MSAKNNFYEPKQVIDNRLMSKLLDTCKDHRDKTTMDIVSFKTTLQVAGNFDEYEKAIAIMLQAKSSHRTTKLHGHKDTAKVRAKMGSRSVLTTNARLTPVIIV